MNKQETKMRDRIERENMEKKKYNGYTNYETWAVSLWLDSDQATQEYWMEAAREEVTNASNDRNFENHIWTIEETRIFRLADRLKEEVTENLPEVEGMASDLLTSALGEVNWQEISENMLEGL